MMWGCVLQANKTHTHLVEDTYQVAQAALEPNSKSQSTSPDLVSVWAKTDEEGEYLLCTLEHGKTWQAPVSLLAMEGSEMAYLVKGDGRVHLTGNLVPEDDEFDDIDGLGGEELSDEEDEELDTSNGEIDARNVINGKRAALALPVANSPAKKMKNEGGKAVAKAAEVVPKKGQVNGAAKGVKKVEDEDEDDDESDEEMDSSLGKLLAGADEEDDDDEEEDDEDDDDDDDEDEDEPVEKVAKQQQSKNASGQQKQKVQIKQETAITPKPNQNKFAGGDQKKQTPGLGKNQQQGNRGFGGNNSFQKGGFNKNQGGSGGGGQQKAGSPFGNNNKQVEAVPRLKQLEILDKAPGHGPVAIPGKMVHVAYVGRLNQSRKEFDRNMKGFSFRLGKGEVIKGWEEGLKNMKVGGKRVIKIPSSLAYGSKKSGPIPANSDLEFEIELKAVTR